MVDQLPNSTKVELCRASKTSLLIQRVTMLHMISNLDKQKLEFVLFIMSHFALLLLPKLFDCTFSLPECHCQTLMICKTIFAIRGEWHYQYACFICRSSWIKQSVDV